MTCPRRTAVVGAVTTAVAAVGGAEPWAVLTIAACAVAALAVGRLRGPVPSPPRGGSQVNVADALAPIVGVTQDHDLRLKTHEIRAATEGQMALVEHMSDALAKLSVSADTVADGAQASAEIAGSTSESARHGGEMVRRLAADLDSAVTVAQHAANTIDELSQRVTEVSDFAAVIDRVAARTRLVALNATIQASHAGDFGKEFNVVAKEVKVLAQQAAEAAKAIAVIAATAGETTARSASSGEAMSAASQRMRAGLQNARDAGESFEGIVVGIGRLSQRIDDVAQACAAQAVSSQSAVEVARGIMAAARTTVASADVLALTSQQLELALDTGSAATILAGDDSVAAAFGQIAHALRPLFDVPREHAGRYVALIRAMQATRGAVHAADLDALDPVMRRNLERFPDARAATVTVEPGTLTDQQFHMHWWLRIHENDRPTRSQADLNPASPGFYDYRAADWYRTPLDRNRTWLSDPYFDDGGCNADIVTISVPVVDDGRALGVATADIGLGQVEQLSRAALNALGRRAGLVTSTGVVVAASSGANLPPGKPLADDLRAWIAAAPTGWSDGGPNGAALAKMSTLDWNLIIWPRGG